MGAGVGRHLYVGDSEVDLQTAQNASIESVFLKHGYGGMGKFRSRAFNEAVELFRWMAQSGPVRKH
jgi:phosphoglycolate phosphatase-like HAD superfamily hydrolase